MSGLGFDDFGCGRVLMPAGNYFEVARGEGYVRAVDGTKCFLGWVTITEGLKGTGPA